MKKSSVPNLILNAFILLEVVLIAYFLLRTPSAPRDREDGPVIPDRELTIAEQEEEAPLPPVVGNSKPVDVEPVEGIRITAPANALDKDREFKITAVDEKTWDETQKALAEVSGEQMLFCFDLDAGMEPDEHLPGEFTFSMDLEKMGIPPILYDKLTVWRLAGDQLYEYTSWVENGKMVFRSDQNSLLVWGCILTVGVLAYSGETWYKHHTTGDLYKNFFSLRDDAVVYEIKDPYGDFTLYFRFKDSEDAGRFDAFKDAKKNLERRTGELEEKADAEYNRQVEAKYNEQRAEWTMWQKVMGSAEAKRKARAAIDKAAILAQYQKEDILLQKYMADAALPPSILDLEKMLKAANRFLTDDQGLRPQTCNLEVDLVMDGPSGEYRRTATKLPYMVINYSKMLSGSEYTRLGKGENMLLTLTHELFHHRQKTHNWPAPMDFRSEETTAAYLENGAALYYVKKGEIVTNGPAALATGKYVGGEGFDPAPRDNYEIFGRSFNWPIMAGNSNLAYTYADFMDYLQQQKKMEPVKGGFIMDQYSYLSSHEANYMKWFGIKDEKEFDRYLEAFCAENLSRIREQQMSSIVAESGITAITAGKTLLFSRAKPVQTIPLTKLQYEEHMMRCYDLDAEKGEGPFNAFVVRDKDRCSPEDVSIYASSDYFNQEKEKNGWFSAGKSSYSMACFTHIPGVKPFQVVALFPPDKPEIKKVKKDYVRFVLPKADKSLVKAGYITGALVTFRNAEGQEKYIRAGIEKLGKDVKWSIPGVGLGGFTLRVKWICENEDGSVYESPASKPAGQGSVPKEKEPVTASANVGKEKKQQEGPKKKEEKKRKQQDAEEKMVVYEEIKEIPWKAVSVTIELPLEGALWMGLDDCYVPKRCVWPPLAEEFPVNGYQLLNPKCEAKFEKAGEGYRLTCKQTLSGTKRKDFLEDGEYHLAVTIFFDEDLHPVKGSFDGTSNQTKILPSWNKKPDGTIINIRDRRVPSTMTYSGTFSFRDGINGRLETLNMKGHWQKLRANRGAEREDVDYSKTMADLEENRGQIRLGLIKK